MLQNETESTLQSIFLMNKRLAHAQNGGCDDNASQRHVYYTSRACALHFDHVGNLWFKPLRLSN